MKKRYGIGFLIGMIVFTLVLVCAYQLSYDRAMRKLGAKQRDIQKKQEHVVETKGSAQKEDGYIIKVNGKYYLYLKEGSKRTNVRTYQMEKLSTNIRQLKHSIFQKKFKKK